MGKNRIVVDYGDYEGLVLLGAFNTRTGEEIPYSELEKLGDEGFEIVEKYDVNDYKTLKKLNLDNKEGYVVRFSNGERCKIKFENYVALHKILTNVTSYDIWENLKIFGKIREDILDDIPDEFYEWVKETESRIRSNFNYVLGLHMAYCSSILRDGYMDRKVFAAEVMKLKDKKGVNHGLIFAIADGKKDMYEEAIWNMVKPDFEKPFSKKV